MNNLLRIASYICLVLLFAQCTSNKPASGQTTFVPFHQVTLTDQFWSRYAATNRQITIPHIFEKCEEMGLIQNFDVASGKVQGEYQGLFNSDEFVYKNIEAASYSLMQHYDQALDQYLDTLIQKIAAAQQPDGYLWTYRIIQQQQQKNAPARWSNLDSDLELYEAGHLYEAAVAHFQATGKKSFLEVAIKNANLVDSLFGEGKMMGVPGHEEIELALVRLYEVTGNKNYLALSRFFIDQRGNAEGHTLYGQFSQDHLPVTEQFEAVGQAPRATYLYAGMADIAYYMQDEKYTHALHKLWENVVHQKMYITGGIGSRHENEGFGKNYELPNLSAYTEICAAVSFTLWNLRMYKLDTDAKYFDVIERTLYNNFLAGVSLTGNHYFYACPTQSDGKYAFNLGWCPKDVSIQYNDASATRKEWFPCACCPPTLSRLIPQIPGMIYAVKDEALFINLFIGNDAKFTLGDTKVGISQTTGYPWSGQTQIQVNPEKEIHAAIHIRIPSWALGKPVPGDLYTFLDTTQQTLSLKVNEENIPLKVEKGYVSIAREWKKGDKISVDFPMPVQRVITNPAVKDNFGLVALQRGPIIYCAEEADNAGGTNTLILPDSSFQYVYIPDVLGGIVAIKGSAKKADQSFSQLHAIPYYAWSNRGVGEMDVWFRRESQKGVVSIAEANSKK